MGILTIAFIAIVLFAAICYSTSCSTRSGNHLNLPKEIADELDPYNKITTS